jgi:hypothetical protein
MTNSRQIKFRTFFREKGAPPQMIYFDKCDFIRDSRGLVVGQVFLNTGITGFSVCYSSIEQPSEADRDQLVGLSDTLWGASHSPLMQFTGLKDKNGREIYEGDIVLLQELGFNGAPSSAKHLCEIFVKEPANSCWFFHARPLPLDGNGRQFSLYNNQYEVVGNVFDNPNLCSE